MMRWIPVLLGVFFVVIVPVFLISSNVRWAANQPSLYDFLFDQHHVVAASGIPKDQLMRGVSQIIHYYNSTDEPLQVVVELNGRDEQIYTPRAIAHMADVKGLFQGTFRVQEASAAFIVAFLLLGSLALRRRFIRTLGKLVVAGSILSIGLVGLLGIASLIASFGPIFDLFHEISFSNDLWRLSSDDYLVLMFPFGFWQDATLIIGGATITEGLALIGITLATRRYTRHRHPINQDGHT